MYKRQDITVGETRVLRGHWADRLADIDADIAAVTAKADAVKPAPAAGPPARAIAAAEDRPTRTAVAARHTAPGPYAPGRPLSLELSADTAYEGVRLHYRQVSQAERWQSLALEQQGRLWRGAIPAEATAGSYPLEYYFDVKASAEVSGLVPGLSPALTGQPYFIARRAVPPDPTR